MGHILKSFIKERLYGKMINYTRKENNKNAKFTPNNINSSDYSLTKIKSTASMQSNEQRKLS